MHKIKIEITKFIKVIMNEIKQTKNSLKKLIKDKNSVFYLANKINRTLLNKLERHRTKKTKFFIKFILD